jgi:hypothetical protein
LLVINRLSVSSHLGSIASTRALGKLEKIDFFEKDEKFPEFQPNCWQLSGGTVDVTWWWIDSSVVLIQL